MSPPDSLLCTSIDDRQTTSDETMHALALEIFKELKRHEMFSRVDIRLWAVRVAAHTHATMSSA
jgi:hypothetical protein